MFLKEETLKSNIGLLIIGLICRIEDFYENENKSESFLSNTYYLINQL